MRQAITLGHHADDALKCEPIRAVSRYDDGTYMFRFRDDRQGLDTMLFEGDQVIYERGEWSYKLNRGKK